MMLQISRKGLALALICVSIAFAITEYQRFLTEDTEPSAIALEALPLQLGSWTGVDTEGLDFTVRDILQLDKFIKRIYTNQTGEQLLIYIGYWTKQSGEHQAAKHSPSVCLPANGWNITRQPKEYVSFPATDIEPLHVKRIIGGVRDKQSLFTYWFFTGAHTYNEEWSALARISLEAAIYGRSDGGIVEISIPIRHERDLPFAEALKEAKDTSDAFIRELYPSLRTITFAENRAH